MLLDRQALYTVESELMPGEKLLWHGRPNPLRVAIFTLPILIPAAFLAIGTGVSTYYWLAGPMAHPGTSPAADTVGIGLTLLLMWTLVAMLLSGPASSYARARSTSYGITAGRIVVVRLGAAKKVESYDRNDIGSLKRVELWDGTGDLTFSQKRISDGRYGGQIVTAKLVGIDRVAEVERLVRTTFAVAE